MVSQQVKIGEISPSESKTKKVPSIPEIASSSPSNPLLSSPMIRSRVVFNSKTGKKINNPSKIGRLSIESLGNNINLSTNDSIEDKQKEKAFSKKERFSASEQSSIPSIAGFCLSESSPHHGLISQFPLKSEKRKGSHGSLMALRAREEKQITKNARLSHRSNQTFLSQINFLQNQQKDEQSEDSIDPGDQYLFRYDTPEEEAFCLPKKPAQVYGPQLTKQFSKIETQEMSHKLKQYHVSFKKLNQIIESNKHFDISNPLDIAMFAEMQNSNVMPRRLGILNDFYDIKQNSVGNNKTSIDLSNQRISEEYAKMIAQALQHDDMDKVKEIKMSNNNLTPSSLAQISRYFPSRIVSINLEHNDLGPHCAAGILPLLNTMNYPQLHILNLEHNKIGDLGLRAIFQGLLSNRSLQVLNLSQNNLTDASADVLAGYIKDSSYLYELYLHWNKLSSQGGVAIGNALLQNNNLQVLDLSHNCLGNPRGWNCALKIIQGCSHSGTSVRHLDLSYNMIGMEETTEMAMFLNNNNITLFGLHYDGNEGDFSIDSRGFMLVESSNFSTKSSITPASSSAINYSFNSRIQGINPLSPSKHEKFSHNTCWICDGWEEVKFEVRASSSSRFMGKPVFLHLDFEQYRPHYMDEDPIEPGVFVLHRMCPPNRKIHFFFSDPTQPVIFYSNNYQRASFSKGYDTHTRNSNLSECYDDTDNYQEHSQVSRHSRAKLFFQKKFFEMKYLDTTVIEYQEPFQANWIKTGNPKRIFCNHDNEPIVQSKPRFPETYFQITVTQDWTYEKSLFRTYIRDTPDLIDRCFEFDWQESRLEKFLPSQKEDCKNKLRQLYPQIKSLYKYFASLGMQGDIPSISLNLFSQISTKMKIADGKLLRISDLDFNFITVNSNIEKVANYRNPDKAIVRHEFLEILPRIAIDKYIRNGGYQSPLEAINMLFSIDGQGFLEKFPEVQDSQNWRDTRYQIKECDYMLKKYLGVIQELWERYADSKKNEKRSFQNVKSMNVFEFAEMVKQLDLLDDQLVERDIYLSFNLAMMTQVDELQSDKYIQMSFVEFLEGIARLAEKKSMVPIGVIEDYSLQERIETRLEYKLESMLEMIKSKLEGGKMNRDRKPTEVMQQYNQNTPRRSNLALNNKIASPLIVSRESVIANSFQSMIGNQTYSRSLLKSHNQEQPSKFKNSSPTMV